MAIDTKPLYLKGLNGIRAIAAIFVIISHILREPNPASPSFNIDKFNKLGGSGVCVFFTLSGFLITYLLLLEKQKNNISIKKFYVRRMLRIWPLYYLYLAIAFLVIFLNIYKSNTVQQAHFIPYYIFFSSNFLFRVGLGGALLIHYWSLAAEEQFYIFWPHLIKRISMKKIMVGLGTFLMLFLLLKLFCHLLGAKYAFLEVFEFMWRSRFDCMAIGAIGACILFFNHSKILKLVQTKLCQIVCLTLLLLYSFSRFSVSLILDFEIIACCATCVILAQVTEKNRIVNLEKPILNYLGKISYGLYVIHPIAIWAIPKVVISNAFNNSFIFYSILFLVTLSVTIALAHLSYNYYEKPFLRLKTKFTIIRSSSSASSETSGIATGMPKDL